MTLCSICGKSNGIYLIKNLSSDEQTESLICEFCEPNFDFTLIEDLSKPKEDILIEQPTERVGRLHIVNKTKKIATCRICKNEIPVGSKCYDQNVYEGNAHFPKKLKVCILDGEKLIAKGVSRDSR